MTYLAVFVLLSALILVHELGHFVVARRLGIPISRFSVGIGPKLWARTVGGTEYRISVIPVGGYVMVSMQGNDAYFALPVYKRILFALGGPLANVLAAGIAFAWLNTIAVGANTTSLLIEPLRQTMVALGTIVATIPQLFTNTGEVSGLVGLIAEGGDFMGGSLVRALQLSIVLNLNLAVINMLPLPPLDGGKVVLYTLEKIDGQLARLHVPLSAAGWVLILGLLTYVTVQDIRRLILSLA